MNKFINSVNKSVGSFVKDEEGAQVVEYALIIAVVSIGLVTALDLLGGADFTTFVGRVGDCLTTATCV